MSGKSKAAAGSRKLILAIVFILVVNLSLGFLLTRQSGGALTVYEAGLPEGSLVPSRCDHPMCGLHGSFIVRPDGRLLPLSSFADQEAKKTTAEQNRAYVARHWLRAAEAEESPCCCGAEAEESPCCRDAAEEPDACCCGAEAEPEPGAAIDMDDFLRAARRSSLTLSAMAFMDAGNLDVERLRHCSLHVWQDGRLKPFCAAYLTPLCAARADEREFK